MTDKPENQFIYVTTIGWRTGSPHEIEIWYVGYLGRYFIVGEGREKAHWVQNIRHNPTISFRFGKADEPVYQGEGRIIDNAAEPALATAVSALMEAKYE